MVVGNFAVIMGTNVDCALDAIDPFRVVGPRLENPGGGVMATLSRRCLGGGLLPTVLGGPTA